MSGRAGLFLAMQDVIDAVKETPIPNLLIAAGLLFLLLGFVTRLGGFLEVSPEQKKLAIPIGLLVLSVGLVLSVQTSAPVPTTGDGDSQTISPPTANPEHGYVRAISDDPNPPTNLRNGPGSDYRIVDRIEKDEIFFVDLKASGDWLPVKTSDHQRGYIYRPLVRVLQDDPGS
jgi:hypothetical protein